MYLSGLFLTKSEIAFLHIFGMSLNEWIIDNVDRDRDHVEFINCVENCIILFNCYRLQHLFVKKQ